MNRQVAEQGQEPSNDNPRRHTAKLVALISLMLSVQVNVRRASGPPLVEVTRQLYLMGTLCTFVHYSKDRSSGLEQLDTFVRIVEETERELSTWRSDTVLSQLNRQTIGTPFAAEPWLRRLFGELLFWKRSTGSAFDPGIGSLIEVWDLRGKGRIPPAHTLKEAQERSGLQHFQFDPTQCSITRLRNVSLDEGAFGKGEALDRILRAAQGAAVTSWLVDLGGQVMAQGYPPQRKGWEVPLAHPVRRDQAFTQLQLKYGSLSTSGGSERDLWTTGGRRIGHHLDPRTGHPATFEGSVAVWHPSGMVADICSTALYVMGPKEGIRWADARDLAACFLCIRQNQLKIQPSRAFIRHFGQFARFGTAPRRKMHE